ncbi:hypothetical protein OG786_29295 [Streptomyces sp. NBC_00101]|uniref:hypothetical protein n=1 Tax=Streptomyces sp. NBC_00101 TaxID=2975651 RepID=UPI00324FC2F7
MFGRRTTATNSNGMTEGQLHAAIRQGREERERNSAAAAAEARGRVQKWDRITRSMTARGEDHEGRDFAIRARTRAQGDLAKAETDQMDAKFERGAFRGRRGR